jgi:hypothetical protein
MKGESDLESKYTRKFLVFSKSTIAMFVLLENNPATTHKYNILKSTVYNF